MPRSRANANANLPYPKHRKPLRDKKGRFTTTKKELLQFLGIIPKNRKLNTTSYPMTPSSTKLKTPPSPGSSFILMNFPPSALSQMTPYKFSSPKKYSPKKKLSPYKLSPSKTRSGAVYNSSVKKSPSPKSKRANRQQKK